VEKEPATLSRFRLNGPIHHDAPQRILSTNAICCGQRSVLRGRIEATSLERLGSVQLVAYRLPRRLLSGSEMNRDICLPAGRLVAKELSEGRYEPLELLDVG
jgi:hypothetical protein